MQQILYIVVILCVLAAALAAITPRAKVLAYLGGAVAVYMVSWFGWWLLLYFQIVPIDPLLARFQIYRLEGFWGTLLFLGPPLIPVMMFVWIARWKGRKR